MFGHQSEARDWRGDGVWDIQFPSFLLVGVEAAEAYIHLPKDMAPTTLDETQYS